MEMSSLSPSSNQSKLSAYNATSDRKVKKDIRKDVIDGVHSRGGRFLEMNKNHKSPWVVVSDMDALQNKLYAFFYQHKKRLDSRASRQSSHSETMSFLESRSKRRKIETGSGCCWGSG